MKKSLTVLALVCSLVPGAQALASMRPPAEAKSCGKWLQDRRTDNWYATSEWMRGYTQAYGYYGCYELQDVGSGALAGWMDSYCSSNPQAALETGVRRLIKDLLLWR